jgi:signal transduction histidine kinase
MKRPGRDRPPTLVARPVANGSVTAAQLAQMFEQAPGFMCLWTGPEHVYAMANAGYRRISGHRALIGRPLREAFPELETQGVFDVADRVYATGEVYASRERRFLLQDVPDAAPREVLVDVVMQPLRDVDGRVWGIFHFGHDVTEQHRTMLALRSSESRYRTLFDSIDDGFCLIRVIVDDSGAPVDYLFLETNVRFSSHTGLVDAVGKTARTLVPGLEQHWFDTYGRVARTGEPVRFELPALTMDDRWFDVYAFPAGEPDEMTVGILFADVSAERRLLANLREADARKDEFLAMLAHELRNPLAPLTNALRLIARSEKLSPAGDRAVAIATRQTGQLARLVDDLLEISRVSRGLIELRRESMSISAAVFHAAESIGSTLEARRQQLEVTVPPKPVQIFADPARVAQILENLLINASKFTPEGGSIRIELDNHAGEVEIRVIDDGVGIEPEKIPRLFELFHQIDVSIARSHGGLGIGLSLVRRLAALHGGRVAAASDGPGKGSTFHVWLPHDRAVEGEQAG